MDSDPSIVVSMQRRITQRLFDAFDRVGVVFTDR